MKSKTGLHKKVACIFDGTPTGAQPPASEAAEPSAAAEPQPPAGQFQPPASTFGPKPVPVTSSQRTAPAKASAKAAAKQNKNMFGLTNKQGKTDPKQLKMLVLVAVLAVALVGVLFFVLSGSPKPPQKAAAAGPAQQPNQTAAAAAAAAGNIPWTRPEPWPEQIRDPMTMGTQGRTAENTPAEYVVKGIVFSQTRPSAIVGNRIVSVGDTINGMTVTAIAKDSVEFEKDGKRWTQQVQR